MTRVEACALASRDGWPTGEWPRGSSEPRPAHSRGGTAIVVALWALWLCATANAQVTVDAATRVSVNGADAIDSRLFGITAFEGFPSVVADRDYRAAVAALRPGCIRLPGVVAWCAPGEFDPGWYDTPDALRQFTEALLFGSRYPIGRFLPVIRGMGAESMCSLSSPPDYLTYAGTGNPSDFSRWAELCAGYVGLWKRADPSFRLVQVWNEPNASWYLDPRAAATGKSAAELHIEMANEVARAIKRRFPDVRVGGPVLCWPPAWPPEQEGQSPWYAWDGWTLPWLEGTRDTIDLFDFHDYTASPAELAVQVEMLANQAWLTQGRRLPIWITESNRNVAEADLGDPAAVWRQRILPYERWLLHGLLPQADKVEGNLVHDLSARAYAILHGSPDSPAGLYRLLWVLRDLRGTRVVADSGTAGVTAFATVEEDRLTLVLFNDSPDERTAPVAVSMPCGWWTGPYVRAIGEGPSGGCEPINVNVALEQKANSANGTVTLPPHATASLSFLMDRFVDPPRTRVAAEHFGDATRRFLREGEPMTLRIRVPPVGGDATATLRVGLLGPTGAESIRATLNGHPIEVRATELQDVQVKVGYLVDDNQLVLAAEHATGNPHLALAFASIVLQSTDGSEGVPQ